MINRISPPRLLQEQSFLNGIKVKRKNLKETDMTNEMTILSEGVILDDLMIEEMEEVIAPMGVQPNW
jgi:hypothetical protein